MQCAFSWCFCGQQTAKSAMYFQRLGIGIAYYLLTYRLTAEQFPSKDHVIDANFVKIVSLSEAVVM